MLRNVSFVIKSQSFNQSFKRFYFDHNICFCSILDCICLLLLLFLFVYFRGCLLIFLRPNEYLLYVFFFAIVCFDKFYRDKTQGRTSKSVTKILRLRVMASFSEVFMIYNYFFRNSGRTALFQFILCPSFKSIKNKK